MLCVDNERRDPRCDGGAAERLGLRRALGALAQGHRQGRLLLGWLPDLVLMDYHLDQTSGLDAVEWLRHNVGGHLPAALVTADRTPQVRAAPRSAASRW